MWRDTIAYGNRSPFTSFNKLSTSSFLLCLNQLIVPLLLYTKECYIQRNVLLCLNKEEINYVVVKAYTGSLAT